MVQQVPSAPNTSGPDAVRTSAGVSSGLLATLAGGGLLVVFMVQNRDDVTLQFLFWGFTVPLWLFTIVVAVLGSIVWIGLGILRRHRRRKARREARRD
ncbi:LapA family protein [Blastococcus sp. CT_GayMR20]|uniref:lipopolysaccharide assembly protein LapA domain-containing protein n=1 Tax=Blastococcus sp. CT_GayMR20 TaxID=2559609 RepID=UPI0010736C41|nr:LapA family protein [Blastococcus sp. CT_GayMR20]TFV92950.1 LapA family protein [Blastococcus sp. CT_GayMR20]